MHSMGWRGFAAAALVVACSGRYEVGEEGTDSSEAGSTGNRAGSNAGGQSAAGHPSFGGAPSSAGREASLGGTPGVGGATYVAGSGGRDPVMQGPPTFCGFATTPDINPIPTVSSEEIWRRITSFLFGQPLEVVLGELPEVPTREWVRETTRRLVILRDSNLGPMTPFRRLLESWSLEKEVAQRYGDDLMFEETTLEDLLMPPASIGPGVLLEPSFLKQRSSIVTRGAFINMNLLCLSIPPPPPDVVTVLPPPTDNVTDRERLAYHLATPACAACHALIDPPGYALGHYDREGQYRTLDNGLPVDASGEFTGPGGTLFRFTDITDLTPQLAASCDAARCFAQQVLALAYQSSLGMDPYEARMLASEDSKLYPVVREFLAGSDFAKPSTTLSLLEAVTSSELLIQ